MEAVRRRRSRIGSPNRGSWGPGGKSTTDQLQMTHRCHPTWPPRSLNLSGMVANHLWSKTIFLLLLLKKALSLSCKQGLLLQHISPQKRDERGSAHTVLSPLQWLKGVFQVRSIRWTIWGQARVTWRLLPPRTAAFYNPVFMSTLRR